MCSELPEQFLSGSNSRTSFFIFPECANTEQFRTAGSRIKIGFDFYKLTEESNPGRLGEKCESYLCAMPSPLSNLFLKIGRTVGLKADPTAMQPGKAK